jgi:predicted exporter
MANPLTRILRALLRLHLRRPAGLWLALAGLTLVLGAGVLRVERRLDLMSLLPTDNPVVRASIEAGVGQQELLWLAAEGTRGDLEAREAWAEHLVENLLNDSGLALNGLDQDGRISAPMPVPEPMGASLWPPLLAAGSFLEGDGAAGRLVTEKAYALAPMLLGDRLDPLKDPAELRRRLRATAKALASPDPAKAKLAQLDPLQLLDLVPRGDDTLAGVTRSARGFPLKLRTGYLETKDGRFVLLPVVLDFPSGDSQATARVLHWLGWGGTGPLPKKAGHAQVAQALAAHPGRPFAIQATGAHAIAYWESYRLSREILMSLGLSFVLIGLVYWIGFRTLAGYGFVVVPLLLGMVWALGLTGWILGRLNLMAAAFGAVLLGIGDDVGIMLFSRHRDERQAGKGKALAIRAALLGTGPGVVAGGLATAFAFLACIAAPFPGFRDLGLTAGLGLLACMASSFLVLPALLLALDRGTGTFAPRAAAGAPVGRIRSWKPMAALALVLAGLWGVRSLTWEEDLRRFRQQGNPALALQETLAHALGAGLQPLAVQIPLDDPDALPALWNRIVSPLRREGLPMPRWQETAPGLRRILASDTWYGRVLDEAGKAGLDPVALERSLSAFRASEGDPLAVPRSLQALMPPIKPVVERHRWTLFAGRRQATPPANAPPDAFTLPLRLGEAGQERIQDAIENAGGRMVGNRPLFRAIKSVARQALREIILLALAAVLAVVALFGRRVRFLLLALVPLAASQIGVLGILGWTGEPLTFLSLVAIPIALGVSVDTAMNLLHRARLEPQAAAKVARVNAVCAGTTLAGFGGLVFSGYRGLQGLGLAALGGVALALLVTQWVLPWLLERWPILKDRP